MTVIIAVKRRGEWAIATDTMVCMPNGLVDRYDHKVLEHDLGWFGFAGSLKESQIAHAAVRACGSMTEVPGAIRDAFKEAGWNGARDDSVPFNEDFVGIALGRSGGIWLIDGKLALRKCRAVTAAVGSGSEVALGAAEALGDGDPRFVARRAVEIACKHVGSCGTPVKVFGL